MLLGLHTIWDLDILTSTGITITVTAMFAPTNTRLTKVIRSVIVSIDQISPLAITSIELSEKTAATIITVSNNALLTVIAIAVPGSVSNAVIIVGGRVSGGTIAVPAAVLDGEPHSIADSADEVSVTPQQCR